MKQVRSYNDAKYFDIRALDGEDGGLYGVVRMGAHRTQQGRRIQVTGICRLFTVDDSGEITLDADSPFFFGNTRDLDNNFNKPRLALHNERYRARSYSEESPRLSRFTDYDLGYLHIPWTDLKLGTSQQGLIRNLTQGLEEYLPQTVPNMERIEIDPEDVNQMRGFGVAMANFPPDMKLQALEQESYYRARQDTKTQGRETVDLPSVTVMSVPMGGLPQWARALTLKR